MKTEYCFFEIYEGPAGDFIKKCNLKLKGGTCTGRCLKEGIENKTEIFIEERQGTTGYCLKERVKKREVRAQPRAG